MAKVNGPLFSIKASGQFASSMVFSEWKGINVVRKKSSPRKASSKKQDRVKAAFKECVDCWNSLSQKEKKLWEQV